MDGGLGDGCQDRVFGRVQQGPVEVVQDTQAVAGRGEAAPAAGGAGRADLDRPDVGERGLDAVGGRLPLRVSPVSPPLRPCLS